MQKSDGLTKSEKHLARLCRHSFLNLWSYPNPFRDQGRPSASADGKELCDLLVICGDHVIIFSDKSCEYRETGRPQVDWQRWYKRAIVKSAQQVRGAERWIRQFPDRVFLDRACTRQLPIALPPPNAMRVHRVVVAHGAKRACQDNMGGAGSLMIMTSISDGLSNSMDGLMPFAVGALGIPTGYIHHFDDVTLDILLRELDTITDFVQYLEKKEALMCSGKLVIAPGEEELLARYLSRMGDDDRHDFAIPDKFDGFCLEQGMWQALQGRPDYIRKKEADRPSYLWDHIIEEFSQHALDGTLIEGSDVSVSKAEQALRIMAKEPRVLRRILSQGILDLLSKTPPGKIVSRRICRSEESELAYVCVIAPEGTDASASRSYRRIWLENYCFVLARRNPYHKTIVGIATESNKGDSNRSWDLCLVQIDSWTEEMKQDARRLQRAMGILDERKTKRTATHVNEYPSKADAEKNAFGLFAETPRRAQRPKIGRNAPCPCGSGQKHKKCCLK